MQDVTRSLTHFGKFSCAGSTGGAKTKKYTKRQLDRAVDLFVSTPGKLTRLLDNKLVSLSDTNYFILDEADTLLHPHTGFVDDINRIMQLNEDRNTQVILCAATTDKKVGNQLRQHFQVGGQFQLCDDCVVDERYHCFPSVQQNLYEIEDETTHKIPKHLTHHFIRVPKGGEWKHNALLEVLRLTDKKTGNATYEHSNGKKWEAKCVRKLVFCNTTSSVRSTSHFLQENNIDNVCLHKDMPPNLRAEQFRRFKENETDTLVCTDAAARGIDIAGAVHVIMFDFPLNPVEYLHRCGRTARANTYGIATSLVTKRDEVLARAIETNARNNLPLVNLSSDRKDYKQLENKEKKKSYSQGKPQLLRKRRLPSKRRKEKGSKPAFSGDDRTLGLKDHATVRQWSSLNATSHTLMDYVSNPSLLRSLDRMASSVKKRLNEQE